MMSELKQKAAASVKPVRAISCTRAERRDSAMCCGAEGEGSGRDDERAEAEGGGERRARQGDQLHARRAARGGLCCAS
jgi:hypothetical protein